MPVVVVIVAVLIVAYVIYALWKNTDFATFNADNGTDPSLANLNGTGGDKSFGSFLTWVSSGMPGFTQVIKSGNSGNNPWLIILLVLLGILLQNKKNF
tara:strand:- start:85 stop:378 length:294 start_codon:yes stop_codon:yes gene_type:complete